MCNHLNKTIRILSDDLSPSPDIYDPKTFNLPKAKDFCVVVFFFGPLILTPQGRSYCIACGPFHPLLAGVGVSSVKSRLMPKHTTASGSLLTSNSPFHVTTERVINLLLLNNSLMSFQIYVCLLMQNVNEICCFHVFLFSLFLPPLLK